MRRSAIYFGAILLITCPFAGCKSKEKTTDMQYSSSSSDLYGLPAADTTASSDRSYDSYDPSFDTYSTPTAPETAYPASTQLAASSSGSRYHTVGKKDTLYSLARTYYGDQRRWKDIYNANQGEISDPNKIFVGQQLIIP